jgi:CBS domain containing-hemolysin-like protein
MSRTYSAVPVYHRIANAVFREMPEDEDEEEEKDDEEEDDEEEGDGYSE